MLTEARLEHILSTIPVLTIGVIGDLFLDRYLDIDASLTEPSLETGLDAYQVVGVRSQPGAAGTVVNNLCALGVRCVPVVSVIGDDGEGYELRQALGRMPAVEVTHVITTAARRTPTYTKPMLHEDGPAARELNRLDIKNRTATPDPVQDLIVEGLADMWGRADALLVTDQVQEEECGVITRAVREALASLTEQRPDRFCLADSRARLHLFRSVDVKPNVDECVAALYKLGAAPLGLSRRGLVLELAARVGRRVFLTAGDRGIVVGPHGPTAEVTEVPACPVSGPIDIVGAGDSAAAALACAMACGASPPEAAAFANLVASITIQQLGTTGTATPEQVRRRWGDVRPG